MVSSSVRGGHVIKGQFFPGLWKELVLISAAGGINLSLFMIVIKDRGDGTIGNLRRERVSFDWIWTYLSCSTLLLC